MSTAVAPALVFISIWSAALFSNIDSLVQLLLVNAALQIPLFVVVACVPFLRSGRMSYVDIAWPFGVALIGVLILVLGDGAFVRRAVVSGVYLFVGLRMGLAAPAIARTTGVIVKTEFPRCQYRRMVLERSGTRHVRLQILADIMVQGPANASVPALPGFLIATNGSDSISAWEVAGLCIWAVAYVFESVADAQKLRFISKHEHGVCDVGLWRYSRHPNYFGEWLVWTGLVVAAVPSWWALRSVEALPVWVALGVGAAGAVSVMYLTLVYLTGAIPAEHYSVRKREGYREYQDRTSMFFPWFPRT